jgi:hypothetical protein
MHCLTRKARRYRRTMAPRYIRQPATRGTFCLTARKPRIRGLPSGRISIPSFAGPSSAGCKHRHLHPHLGQIRIGMTIRLPKRFALPARLLGVPVSKVALLGEDGGKGQTHIFRAGAGAREGSPASSSALRR